MSIFKKIYIGCLLTILGGFLIYLFFFYYEVYQTNKKTFEESKDILRKEYLKNKETLNKKEQLLSALLESRRSNTPNLKQYNQNSSPQVLFKVFLDDSDREAIVSEVSKELTQLKLKEAFQKVEREKLFNKQKEMTDKRDLYLSIPKINLNLTTYYTSEEDSPGSLIGHIDNVLKKGAVRYPYNNIINKGATYIFGHSSQFLNTYKDYSYFRQLPLLTNGDIFDLKTNSFNNKGEESYYKYNYKVIASQEVKTEDLVTYIESFEKEFTEEKLVVLITCYPLNTTERRWIVVGSQTKTEVLKKE